MFLFDYELADILAAVRSGRSVRVHGPTGVGLSTVLETVVDRLEREGYLVLSTAGTALTASVAGYALRPLIGDVDPGSRTGAIVQTLVSELEANRLRAIVLDSIENLDPLSVLVIRTAAGRTSTPIVFGSALTPAGAVRTVPALAGLRSRLVELRALDFIRLTALVQDHLGSSVEVEIASRAFARSSGITGLALAAVDGARESGSISLQGDTWVLTGAFLWSEAIEEWAAGQLAAVPPVIYDAVEHLAVSHGPTRPGDCTVLPPEVLREVESRGLVAADARGGERFLFVTPSALGEVVASRWASSVIGLDRTEESSESGTAPPLQGTGIALNLRAQSERRLLDLAHRWRVTRRATEAVPYLLQLAAVPGTRATVRDVIERTEPPEDRDGAAALDLLLLRALLARTGDAPPVRESDVDALTAAFPSAAPTPRFLSSLVRAIEMNDLGDFRATPADPGSALETSALSYIHLAAGRFDEAARVYARIPASESVIVERYRRFSETLIAVGAGRASEAVARARQDVAEARELLDHGRMLLCEYAAALVCLVQARWTDAGEVVDDVLSLGRPGSLDLAFYRAIVVIAAIAQLARGEDRLASVLLAEARSIETPDGPLPLQQAALAAGLEYCLAGDRRRGLEVIRTTAVEMMAAGYGFAAAMLLRLCLVLGPDLSTLEALRDVPSSRHHPESTFRVIAAAIAGDASVVTSVTDVDRADAAFVAAVLAECASQPDASVAAAERSARALAKLEAVLGRRVTPLIRSARVSLPLSAREEEIAMLARTHSNAEIAQRLRLSVRTVENHLYNAMRKTGSTSRSELFGHVSETGPGAAGSG